METALRSWAKAISWRFFALIITALVVLATTGAWELALGIASLDTLVKIFAYFLHERIWNRIPYGRPKAPGTDWQI